MRRLTLKRETLAALSTDELAAVAAGAGPTGPEPTPPVYAVTHTCFDSNVVCWGPYLTQGSSCDYC